MRTFAFALALALPLTPLAAQQSSDSQLGYFRYPSVHGNTVVFTAEGDLWKVPLTGGNATRLTTASGDETHAAISPDGSRIAFSASYEGPTEVYVMPIGGGAPTRLTYEGSVATVVGWTSDGKVLYSTREYSGLPDVQLAWVTSTGNTHGMIPLAQAADGSYDPSGTLFFTRYPFQGSYTKRYHGGTAQSIWRFDRGGTEARNLTTDYTGTSREPMTWQGRIYFNSDRDGVMNIWSMDAQGHDLKQLTHQRDFDVKTPSLSDGKVVYQSGADLRVCDVATGSDAVIPIQLVSDFEQTREKWDANPLDLLTSAHLSPTGDRVVLTSRGQVFIAPVGDGGRLAQVTQTQGVRYRLARFMPDGSLLGLSDKSGEVEFWRVPTDGSTPSQLTHHAQVLRWDGIPSPDGRYIAHTDKNQQLWLLNVATGADTLLAINRDGDFGDVQWAPDSRWVAYTAPASNQFNQIYVYGVDRGQRTAVTSDRYDSYSPTWSPDGKWLYFLSDRHFQTTVGSPWGSRQPEAYFPNQTEVFALALRAGERSPFAPDNELTKPVRPLNGGTDSARSDSGAMRADTTAPRNGAAKRREPVPVTIDLDGIADRLIQLPIRSGEYSDLSTDGKRIYFIARPSGGGGGGGGAQLMTYPIDNDGGRPQPFITGVSQYELSMDGKHLLVRRGNAFFVFDAGAKAPSDTTRFRVDLSHWLIHVDPRAEWRQEFVDAWRLERDYFYDQHMNGVDWPAIRARYAPLVERVTDRAELSDLIAQAVGELSALHTFVRGGDVRSADDSIHPAALGAMLARDDAANGYRVVHIYRNDPDAPDALSPLARYGINVHDGDVITAVNHVPALSAPDLGSLLRNQSGSQVLLSIKPNGNGTAREVVVEPITQGQESNLRYAEWEYARRLAVDSMGHGDIGYLHLRAMGGADMNQWERDFYPVFTRKGLIIDDRHNRGGNIDSWVLSKLIRKAWFYFQNRVGDPTWNMQYAFRGHIVVLTDAFTASDGEAFAEGFRNLGLGKLVGVRTWGGEIWLSQSNVMVDQGIASAAEMGTYLPNSTWMIEGHGVDPDLVVDNLPHATFNGRDAQLEAAVRELQAEIKADPRPVPPHPAYPDKSRKPGVGAGGG